MEKTLLLTRPDQNRTKIGRKLGRLTHSKNDFVRLADFGWPEKSSKACSIVTSKNNNPIKFVEEKRADRVDQSNHGDTDVNFSRYHFFTHCIQRHYPSSPFTTKTEQFSKARSKWLLLLFVPWDILTLSTIVFELTFFSQRMFYIPKLMYDKTFTDKLNTNWDSPVFATTLINNIHGPTFYQLNSVISKIEWS